MINRLRSFYFLESRGSRQFVIYKNCLKLIKKRGLGIAHLKRETQHLNKKTWYLTRQEFELQKFGSNRLKVSKVSKQHILGGYINTIFNE